MATYLPRPGWVNPNQKILNNEYIKFDDWAIITINNCDKDAPLIIAPAGNLLNRAVADGFYYFKYFIVNVPKEHQRRFRIDQNLTTLLVAAAEPIEPCNHKENKDVHDAWIAAIKTALLLL